MHQTSMKASMKAKWLSLSSSKWGCIHWCNRNTGGKRKGCYHRMPPTALAQCIIIAHERPRQKRHAGIASSLNLCSTSSHCQRLSSLCCRNPRRYTRLSFKCPCNRVVAQDEGWFAWFAPAVSTFLISKTQYTRGRYSATHALSLHTLGTRQLRRLPCRRMKVLWARGKVVLAWIGVSWKWCIATIWGYLLISTLTSE